MYDDHVALHWHPRVGAWLPPGGHVHENEDPVQAVLREIQEETGLKVAVVPSAPTLRMDYPTQVEPPLTIMIEDIDDPESGFHQHIDMIYVCRPTARPGRLHDGWVWVSRQWLSRGEAIQRRDGRGEPPPEDVRVLAGQAFELVERGGLDAADEGRPAQTA